LGPWWRVVWAGVQRWGGNGASDRNAQPVGRVDTGRPWPPPHQGREGPNTHNIRRRRSGWRPTGGAPRSPWCQAATAQIRESQVHQGNRLCTGRLGYPRAPGRAGGNPRRLGKWPWVGPPGWQRATWAHVLPSPATVHPMGSVHVGVKGQAGLKAVCRTALVASSCTGQHPWASSASASASAGRGRTPRPPPATAARLGWSKFGEEIGGALGPPAGPRW